MITIKDLIEHRTRKEKLVRRVASTACPRLREFTHTRTRRRCTTGCTSRS